MNKLLGLLLLTTPLFSITKEDFAYSKALTLPENTSIAKVTLDRDIYKHAFSNQLLDVVILDANNHLMPKDIKRSNKKISKQTKVKLEFVKFSKLSQKEKSSALLSYKGATISLSESTKSKKDDYIINLTRDKNIYQKLFISTSNKEFMTKLSLSCSQDLQSWQNLNTHAVLASLSFQGSSIVKNEINLPYKKCLYLRLQSEESLSITKIEALAFSQTTTLKSETLKLNYQKRKDAIEFELSKKIKLDSISLSLSNTMQLYKLKILARNTRDEKWHSLKTDAIYVYKSKGKTLTKNTITLNAHYNYYRIQAQKNSYLPSDFTLTGTRKVEHLYFLAQGKAPYTLAYGSFSQKVHSMHLSDVTQAKQVEISKETLAGGEEQLKDPKEKLSSKKYLVYVALAVALGLLVFMALRLYKQMPKED